MLGMPPQPTMAESGDLLAERCTVEMVALGQELMITSQHGATFLIADARMRTADSICVWVGSEGPVAPSDLVSPPARRRRRGWRRSGRPRVRPARVPRVARR